MIQKSTFQFLKQLTKNNEKAWFDEHRSAYLTAREDVIDFLTTILGHLAKKEASYAEIKPASCLFRINRDVRFSANKAPYKTNFGAALNPQGKKSGLAGLYVHLEPGGSFVGGGLWMPPTPVIHKVRQEIDYQTNEFLSIINKPSFKQTYADLDTSDSLKKLPKEYTPGHAAEKYLKLKSFVAFNTWNDEDFFSKDAAKTVAKQLWDLQPLLAFMNRGLTD